MARRARITVKARLKQMKGLRRDIERGLKGSRRSGPFGEMWTQIGVRYLTFVQRRFKKNSEGGGDWPPLKYRTILGRRSRRKSKRRRNTRSATELLKVVGSAKILRDTGTLYQALSVGARGNRFDRVKGGVVVGFSSRERHEGKKGEKPKTRVTIARLATWHNLGKGNNPQRPILVEPDEKTQAAIGRYAKAAIRKAVQARRERM